MSITSISTVTETLTRFDALARQAVETGQVHIFMQTHGDEIVSY